MARRRMTPLALFAFAFALLIGTAPAADAATRYTCPNRVCSFSVADTFAEVGSDDTSLTLRDEQTGGVFAVLLQEAPQGASLDTLTLASVGEFAKRDGFQADPVGIRDETVGGATGKSFTFASNNSSGAVVIGKVYFFVQNGVFYALNFATTPESADAFIGAANDILASFRFD